MSELANLLTGLVNEKIGEDGSTAEVMGRLLVHTDLSNDELRAYLDGDSELYTERDDNTVLVVPTDIRNFASFFGAEAGDLLAAALDDGLLTVVNEDRPAGATLREIIPVEQYKRLLDVRAQLDEALET